MATHLLEWRDPVPASCRGGAVAIGNFDGVHLGHAVLLRQLGHQARAAGGPAVALTFDPHPRQLLRPHQSLPLLTTPDDRHELLRAGGVDEVLVLRTTPEMLRLTAEEFFAEVMCGRLAVKVLVEGADFRFGRDREGNVETLARLCRAAGVGLVLEPPFRLGETLVSSSAVRSALARGDAAEAARLLGRPYRLRGVVGGGARRGRTIGFPTANLERAETVVPGNGVYAVRALWRDGSWPAAANVGPNPTFGESARKVEVHLIGFEGDLYGEPLAADFVQRLRDTRPFAGVQDLVEQLKADVEQAKRVAGPAR